MSNSKEATTYAYLYYFDSTSSYHFLKTHPKAQAKNKFSFQQGGGDETEVEYEDTTTTDDYIEEEGFTHPTQKLPEKLRNGSGYLKKWDNEAVNLLNLFLLTLKLHYI